MTPAITSRSAIRATKKKVEVAQAGATSISTTQITNNSVERTRLTRAMRRVDVGLISTINKVSRAPASSRSETLTGQTAPAVVAIWNRGSVSRRCAISLWRPPGSRAA